MQALPRELWSAAQVRELDRRAIEHHGIPGYTLMCRAGAAALDALLGGWPTARRLTVLCGGGNNGGDGYVLARLAREAGLAVELVAVRPPAKLAGDAARAWEDYRHAGGAAEGWQPGRSLEGDGVLVDALLGTGLDRPVEGLIAEVIDALNDSGRPVLALDVPSGLDADGGAELGHAVRADLTVTFVGLKLGLFTGRGPALAGRIAFSALGVPPQVAGGLEPVAMRLDPARLVDWLPPRRRDAHKGDHGHVLVVGGEEGTGGAVCMAAEAALRAGAGLVSVATRRIHVPAILAARPEVMCRAVESADDLADLLSRADVLAVGPGLGTGEWGRTLLEAALASGRPVVLDADALNLLATHPRRREDWILTPHPGEAGRLLGRETAAVQRDRPAAARALQERFGGVVVLKGAGTLVASARGPLWVCDRGNPGLATGGTGDVLTGLAAGLLAQLRDPLTAARAAVLVHALAGDDAAARGERGLLAGDLLEAVRPWVNPHRASRPA